MVDINVTVSIDVFCNECGVPLNAEHNSIRDEINVDPCEGCMNAKYVEGVTDGSEAAE